MNNEKSQWLTANGKIMNYMNNQTRKIVMASVCMASTMSVSFAQLTVKVSLASADTAGIHAFIYPLGVDTSDDTPMKRETDGTLTQTVASSETGLYNMVFVSGTAQYSMPLFIDPASHETSKLEVNLDGTCPHVTQSASQHDNDALAEFNDLYYRQSKEVWTNASKMTEDDIRNMVKAYDDAARKTESAHSVNSNVKEYIKIWAYLQGVESGTVFNRLNDKKVTLFGDGDALMKGPSTVLDSPIAILHQSSVNTAAQALPKGSLETRLQYINDKYSTPAIRKGIQRIVLNSFIRNYDYTKGYQEGLAAMNSAKEKFGIDESFVNNFKERVSAIPGAKFPDVELIDTTGRKVSMAMFKGKYVYVDLWASWCVPCCKQVPYLQALEKELQNKNVVFVSISTDSSEAPWKKKMEQLDMHGNQWLNPDGKLCDKLNVSGIPHFLIYDKEGNLHTYDAQRPSSGDVLKNILEGLR